MSDTLLVVDMQNDFMPGGALPVPNADRLIKTIQTLVHPNTETCIIMKGRRRYHDSYSGFFDDGGEATKLTDRLNEKGVTDLYVCGVATEYCVKFTVLDAIKEGFGVKVLTDAIAGINSDDEAKALIEMMNAGAELESSVNCEQFSHTVLTMDSHPEVHCSFKKDGGIWPKHCVFGTNGLKSALTVIKDCT